MNAGAGLLAPRFEHRFSDADILGAYTDLEVAFAVGDYNLVAAHAPAGSELQGCALVLAGLYGPGLAVLETFDGLSPMGLLCRGFGRWNDDRPEQALVDLAKITSDPVRAVADALAQAIQSPEIVVWVMAQSVPIFTSESANARDPEIRYGQFLARHVTSQLDRNCYEGVYDFNRPLDTFIDSLPAVERPRFLFSASPQFLLPEGYERVRQGRYMWCHDTDLFLYRGYDNFRANTVNIVTTSQEHFELSRALGVPAAANLMSDTLCMPAHPTRRGGTKDIDVLLTGGSVLTLHSEKARWIYHLNKLGKDFSIQVVDGHLSQAEYQDLLARTWFTPIVNRYAGATSPRWREGLAQGGLLLFPQGVPYDHIVPGCLPVRAEALAEDLRRHLQGRRDHAGQADSPYDTDGFFDRVDDGLAFLRHSRDRQVERQLRFCLLLDLLRPLDRAQRTPAVARRFSWYVPTVDVRLWGETATRKQAIAAAHCAETGPWRDDKDCNNAALMQVQMEYALPLSAAERAQGRLAWRRIIDQGLGRFPHSLLLRFNQAHWGFMEQIADGVPPDGQAFAALLDDFDTLAFDAPGADLGIAYVLGNRDKVFPYYDYGQLVLCRLVRDASPGLPRRHDLAEPRQVVRAAVLGYVGWARALAATDQDAAALAEALTWMNRSLAAHGDNLPLLQLRQQTATRLFVRAPGKDTAQSVLDGFVALAEKYPAALATDIVPALDAAARLGRDDLRRALLREWDDFTAPIRFAGPFPLHARMAVMDGVLRHAQSLPAALAERLAAWRRDGLPSGLPQRDADLARAQAFRVWRQRLGR